MESGTPGRKATADGWLNRALPEAAGKPSPVRAVSLGPALPRALRGHNDALAVSNLNQFQVREASAAGTFESMYEGALDQTMKGAGRETFEAVKMVQTIQRQPYAPANQARYPQWTAGPGAAADRAADQGGCGARSRVHGCWRWDTHVNEVGARPSQGQLANLLGEFRQSLAAFHQDLGDRMADVLVVTMSEFGRTARENGNRGTDHGHANVMLVMGGDVRGGKVYGDWPGLGREQLYEERDLAVTTDFRDVLGELVADGLGNRDLASVFPGYTPRFRNLL